ncbi:TetR/AcrR family transcriptional regulator [Tumebacillus flagellatus]|uniref:TetR family transcriptional regulator n=1 Tax=Tumebacillus flagellatus TaxID=1157490 RepID=A0A074MCP9_9BACL|nr:TetR/AcrR family transcriptional regulator [Tumebacillus flagellatus]KEO83637.1 TetR family transcriptional regulator [Tumebacillus flagellatus]
MTNDAKPIPSRVLDPQKVEARRLQIVQAAVELFVEKGFHKTTTREIAKASGIGIGTLYEYLQSKEDVLYLVCAYIHSEVEKRLTEARLQAENGRDLLVQSVRRFFACVDELQNYVLLIYQETKSLPPDTLKLVLQQEEAITQLFADILEKGRADGSIQLAPQHVKLMAHNIIVLGQMWTFRRWALHRHYTLEEYTERQVKLLLQEIHAP